MELIELRELQPEPRPGRGRLERTNALRISPARRHGPGARPEPRPAAAPSTGHRFEPRRRGLHTWCDLCGDFVWGGGRKSLQCRHCSFTCHYRCRALVRLDCSGPPGNGDEDDGSEQELEKDTNVVRDHGDGRSGVDTAGGGTAQAGPCQDKAHRAMPRDAVLCHATARCAMPRYALLCHAVPCRATPCRARGSPGTPGSVAWVKSPPETGPHRPRPASGQRPRRGGAGLSRAGQRERAGERRAGRGVREAPGRAGTETETETGTGKRDRIEPGLSRGAAPSRAKRSERSGAVLSRAGAGGLARGRACPCARAGAAAAVAGVGGGGGGGGAEAGGCGAAAALALRWGGAGGSGGSAASSGYCSQEDSDSEPELFYTARTSFGRRPRRRQDEPSSWETAELDPAQVEQRIKEYNSQINSNLFMSLNKDGSYTGFIKVQLKLARPVSVPAAKRGPGGRSGQRAAGVKRRTSFYLPRGTVKHLHVFSHTRASEVISALLRKFTVVDDPRKFALFERSENDEQVYLRKLADEEQPLRLRLLAGPSEKALSFVLKENESGEVNWDAFSLPELHNFLRILQREEDEQLRRVRHRYARCRRELQAALAARTPG